MLTCTISTKSILKRTLRTIPLFLLSQSTTAMSTTTSSPKSNSSNKAALIFLHGLGDTPAGWTSLSSQLPSMQPSLSTSNIEYVFPPADTIPITINGGMTMPGWFDIFDWPIGVGCKNDEDGLKKAVDSINACVVKLEAKGIQRNRIVVGGFSQGGAVALRAVYQQQQHEQESSDEESKESLPFAACVNLSGWLTFEETNGMNDNVPLLWGHGSYDDKVLFDQQSYGVAKLGEMGVKSVEDSSYPVGHGAHPDEMVAFAKFLDQVLFPKDDSCKE